MAEVWGASLAEVASHSEAAPADPGAGQPNRRVPRSGRTADEQLPWLERHATGSAPMEPNARESPRTAPASVPEELKLTSREWWTPRRKVIAFNLGAAAAIAGFGTLSWDYGSQSFRFGQEGWFEKDTGSGGADKLGHAWAFYAVTNVYTRLFEHWGHEREKAAAYAALSSWTQGLLVEIGDGFSREHGFSYEDLLANTAGIALGYLRQRYPRVRETVDFRLEWVPTRQFRRGDRLDPFTDYSGQKYLLAWKLGNILGSESPFLQALEMHTGYYTRGFTSGDTGPERRFAYAGLGLNVSYLLEKTIRHRVWNLFDYVQVPYTYVPARHSFD